MKYWNLIVLLALLGFSSCSEYQKLLKSPDAELKLSKAIEYYTNKDYARALTLFEGLMQVYKGTDKAELVFYYYAYCQYAQEDYILAGYYFQNFTKTFPSSEHAEECQFLGAYCFYKQSPKTTLDQSSTRDAINEFQLFISLYPKSERLDECNKIVDELRGKLEEKSFINAKLYYELDLYKAARISLKNSLKEYPDSKYREELMYLVVKSNYLYASNSVEAKKKERFEETLKECYAFRDEFAASKHKKEIDRIFENSTKYIEQN